MRIDFIADTNFLIYLHEGDEIIKPFLNYNFGISFISEVELLGFKNITKSQELELKSLINDSYLMEWNNEIKNNTIAIRRKYSLKLPDAIIAATAIVHATPLVSADKSFSQIEELDLVLITF